MCLEKPSERKGSPGLYIPEGAEKGLWRLTTRVKFHKTFEQKIPVEKFLCLTKIELGTSPNIVTLAFNLFLLGDAFWCLATLL